LRIYHIFLLKSFLSADTLFPVPCFSGTLGTMKNARTLLLQKFSEIVIDGFLVILAFIAAYIIRIGQLYSTDFPFWPYLQLALWVTPVFLLILAWSGLYSLREKTNGELFRMISLSALSGTTLFVLIFFFQREFFFSRLIVLLVFLFATLYLFSFHYILSLYTSHKHKKGKGVLKTLFIGNGKATKEIIKGFQNSGTRYFPVGILAPYGGGGKEIFGVPVLGKLDALESAVKENNIDALFQTEAGEQTINLLLFAEGKFLEFHICPAVFGAFRNTLVSEKIAGLPFLGQSISPLFGWGQVAKRATDIFLSSLGILLLSPLFLAKKIRKKEFASGPKNNVFHKFEFAHSNGFGKYLPELMNVFVGQMSLVGPRPRSAKERDDLKLHERRRLVVKPGIFGPWQLHRLKTSEEDQQKAIEMDVKYIFEWNYWNDIRIIFKCLLFLLQRK
jgi:lipopolysaccharide/colanic/teichoic acid biosynthesis glycosyltransferase